MTAISSILYSQIPIIETRPLPEPRAFHGTAAMGDYLYVIGGGTLTADKKSVGLTSVLKSKINSNGQLDPWEKTTELPGPRFYIQNSTLVLNDVVYVIGGSESSLTGDIFNTAMWAKPLPDGTLTPWVVSQPFGEGYSAAAAVATPGHLHVLGGQKKGNVLSNEVWTNSIYLDGSIGKWEPGPPLPYAVWFHHAGVVAGRVYVWGGLPGTDPKKVPPLPYVISSPILASGKLGPWRREQTNLQTAFYGAASAVAGHYLLSFSPRYAGGAETNDIWWTYVTPQGVMPFTKRETDIPIRIYHAVATDYRRGAIYIPAGRPERANLLPTNRVFFFQLTQQAREQAEQTWQAAQRAHANSVMAATNDQQTGAPRQLTYMSETRLSADAVPGFSTVTAARELSAKSGKPMIMYFTLKGAQPCVEQNDFLRNGQFNQLTNSAVFAWVDTTEFPQLTQQMGVYRVPTWIFYDAKGVDRGRRVGVLTTEEIAGLLPHLM